MKRVQKSFKIRYFDSEKEQDFTLHNNRFECFCDDFNLNGFICRHFFSGIKVTLANGAKKDLSRYLHLISGYVFLDNHYQANLRQWLSCLDCSDTATSNNDSLAWQLMSIASYLDSSDSNFLSRVDCLCLKKTDNCRHTLQTIDVTNSFRRHSRQTID